MLAVHVLLWKNSCFKYPVVHVYAIKIIFARVTALSTVYKDMTV